MVSMNSTTFSMTVLFVENIDISKKFYQTLFDLKIKHDFGENIVFEKGFSLWQKKRAHQIIFGKENSEKNMEKNAELYFETRNIEKVWSAINQDGNIEIIHNIKEENWGQKTIRIFDPDKFIIEIAEPMDQVVERLSSLNWEVEKIANKTQLPISEVKKILRKK